MKEILFRGKRVDNGEWIEGYYFVDLENKLPYIMLKDRIHSEKDWMLKSAQVKPETVGQLRHRNAHGKYFDGDIYYCAGYGEDIVSDCCEITFRLAHGDVDDIGEIIGNIHDNQYML